MDLQPWLSNFSPVLLLFPLFLLALRGVIRLWLSLDEVASEAPPGEHGIFLHGETLHFLSAIYRGKGFYDFVQLRRARFGKCFKTNIYWKTQVFVSTLESAKIILNDESGIFTKTYMKSIASLVGDHSVLCAPRNRHKVLRGRLLKLFSTSALSVFIKQFDELVARSLQSWADQDIIIVLDKALKITFRAMSQMLLNLRDGPELQMLEQDIVLLYKSMLALPLPLPGFMYSKGLQARKRIMKTFDSMMNEKRRSPGNESNFLHRILNECDSYGINRLTDEEIKDNILTMIIAGQDTTANAITWMVKYLGENQQIIDKLRAEQVLFEEGRQDLDGLSLEDLDKMPYAYKVVKESLRMASVVAWFPRLALQECEMEGYKMRKGWRLNVDAKAIHFDPELYCNPHNFNPSRFDHNHRANSFLAFGMGARQCLGMNMAKAMMQVFLYHLVATYEWKVMNSDPIIETWALFSWLKSGFPIKVSPRKKKSSNCSS